MKFWRDVLLQHWGLKLTSIVLAFFLWLAVRGEPLAERVLTVPLEIIRPVDMEIVGERPSTVDVTLRGAANSMRLGQPAPACRIDLQNMDEGEHVVVLTEANVRMPRASTLEVVAIRPARLKLILERTISKAVPIRVSRGDPPLDLEVYTATVTPPSVVVTGARTRVQEVREIVTESIHLAGQRESFRTLARLAADDSLLHLSPPGPVEVYLQIGARRQLQTISRIPVTVDDPSASVSPQMLTVSILVPTSVKRNLTAADFQADVSTKNLNGEQATHRVRPDVRLKEAIAPGTAIVKVTPAEVAVRRAAND